VHDRGVTFRFRDPDAQEISVHLEGAKQPRTCCTVDASAWTAVGKANLILDSSVAEAKAKPMIIVMPLGYGAPEIVQRSSGAQSQRQIYLDTSVQVRSAQPQRDNKRPNGG
jgi:hypothetical protein